MALSARPAPALRRRSRPARGWIRVSLVCPDCAQLLRTFRNAPAPVLSHDAVVVLRTHRLTCRQRPS